MQETKDPLDVNVRDIEASLACFTEECVTEQIHGSPREEDPLMRTLSKRLIDYGMEAEQDER